MKKQRFKPRLRYVEGAKGRTLWKGKQVARGIGLVNPIRVRVTDARDMTPEKAIEKCINQAWINTGLTLEKACKAICPKGYSASTVNFKVCVRRLEK